MTQPSARRPWVTRGVVGIVLATFFSDVAHEAATSVLPLYLASIGLGAAALGAVEGFADLVYSLAKLGGGYLGHHVRRKQPLVALGYAVTMGATASIALVRGAGAILGLRALAWIGRGLRSPLRDHLLADEVEPSHYARAYGLERSADMLGALVGPLVAVLLVAIGLSAREIIAWTLVPALVPVLAIAFLTRDRVHPVPRNVAAARAPLPGEFKRFLAGVAIFGMGDFSRTFLILLAARALGETQPSAPATLSIAVLLYALHNGISALAAYPIGRLGDRLPKARLLVGGYALGVVTNLILAFGAHSIAWLLPAIVLSAVYIAAEETLEKATGAALLPRESRSLGLGVLGSANAVGDMVSSLGVGVCLEAGLPGLGFGLAAGVGAIGTAWMLAFARRAAKSGLASGV